MHLLYRQELHETATPPEHEGFSYVRTELCPDRYAL